MKAKQFKKENRAFVMWAQKTYGEHPIGALLLATYMYECCRKQDDAITWELMKAMGFETFTSQNWLDAATEILKT